MWFKKKTDSSNSAHINPDYEPNAAEKAHFVRKFRHRRKRQRWLLTLFLLLPTITAGGIYWQRAHLFRDGEWQHPSIILLVFIAMFVIAELATLAMTLVNWRCSHCEHLAPWRPHPARCKHCNAPLRSSELSD